MRALRGMTKSDSLMLEAGRAARTCAVLVVAFSVALELIALFDDASLARFPNVTQAFMLMAAIAYTAVGVAMWRLGRALEPIALLNRYRYLLLVVLAAYVVSFGPLAAALLPLAFAATGVAPDVTPARRLLPILRLFLAVCVLLAVLSLVVALRSEEIFRRRLEGLALFSAYGVAAWHAAVAVIAGMQAAALKTFVTHGTSEAWQSFAVTYRRTWRVATFTFAAMLAIFLAIVALIHLERGAPPPR